MKNKPSGKKVKTEDVKIAEVKMNGTKADAKACCGHRHGVRHIFIGSMFMIAGIMLLSGYGLAQVFIVIGGLLVIKGILVTSIMSCKNK